MSKLGVRQPNRETGQDAVEFAILLPVLLLIAFGILDLGRLYFAAITITNAAREGARFGIEHPADFDGIRDRAQAEAVGTGIDLSDASLATITPLCVSGCARGTALRVDVTYNLQLIVPGFFGWNEVPLASFAEMQVP